MNSFSISFSKTKYELCFGSYAAFQGFLAFWSEAETGCPQNSPSDRGSPPASAAALKLQKTLPIPATQRPGPSQPGGAQ